LNFFTLKLTLFCFFVQFCITLGFSEENNTMATISSTETVVASCSLKIRINPLESTANPSAPKAIVEVTLVNREGDPISGGNIVLSATAGTLLCNPEPVQDSSNTPGNSDSHACFITGEDGKALVDLINIPYNTAVRVKASYDCGDYTIRASGNLLLSKKVIHKK
jgi:hypothetical protein